MTDRVPESAMVRSRRARFSPAASACAIVIGGIAGALMIAPVACSSNDPIGSGGTCFQTTDCAEGLVCIPQKNGSRICSSDLSSIQMSEADASDAGGGGGGGGGGGTPPTGDGGGTTPPTDSGGTTPPVDSGGTTPPDDSGSDT